MVHFLGGDGDGKHSGSTSAPGGLKVLSWRADWISILVEGRGRGSNPPLYLYGKDAHVLPTGKRPPKNENRQISWMFLSLFFLSHRWGLVPEGQSLA